jgi:hypothetical protein
MTMGVIFNPQVQPQPSSPAFRPTSQTYSFPSPCIHPPALLLALLSSNESFHLFPVRPTPPTILIGSTSFFLSQRG